MSYSVIDGLVVVDTSELCERNCTIGGVVFIDQQKY